MANVVIVTRQCYLLCESINYIAINEVDDDKKHDYSLFNLRTKKKRKLTAKQKLAAETKQYHIIIDFVPISKGNGNMNPHINKSSSDDTSSVAVTVTGRERCLELFGEMVSQIREQMPDQLFLDKIVEKFLTDNNNNT